MRFRFISGGRRALTGAEREMVGAFARLLLNGTEESRLAALVAVLGFEIERRGLGEQHGIEWALATLDELGFGSDRPIELHLPGAF